MALQLFGERECAKGDQTYVVKVFFDEDTNTQRHEYVLNGEILFHLEYEFHLPQEPAQDDRLDAIVEGFDLWYDQVGPDWRPEAF